MSQEPSVLLVDLPEQGAAFAQALSQVGRPSASITVEQLAPAFAQGKPLGVVTLAKNVSVIAGLIREQAYPNQLPLFVLQNDSPGSIRPPLPEVTAVVPEGVEPGILALRIQQALQQVGGPRPRQATVLGMGSMSQPQALPSRAPSKPPTSSPIAGAKGASTSASKAPHPSALAPKVAPAPSKPPEVPWNDPAPSVVSSAPPVQPKSSSSAPKPAVVSSAPPLPEIPTTLTPSGPQIPEAAPLPTALSAPSGLGASTAGNGSPPSGPSGASEAVPTHPPVALNPTAQTETSSSLDADIMAAQKTSMMPKVLVAAGVLAAAGIGAVVLSGGSEEKAQAESVATTSAEAKAQTSPAAKPAPAEPAALPKEEKKPAEEAEEKPAEPEASGEAALFLVEGTTAMDSCEKALGKTPSDFASAKKWRASQSWKQARRSLMAGKEDTALQHMCEAAFIDAGGPASIGLAKYYMGKRALEEAHKWAKTALDAAPGASSKRTAQQILGDVLSQMGKIDEARALWLESFNLTADQKDRLAPVCRNFINAAVKARKGGDPALAEQLLRRVVAFEPDNVNATALLASTLLENEQKKLAKLWAERTLKQKPGLEMAQQVIDQL